MVTTKRCARAFHASGFTIVEALVVIAVLALLLGLAGPALSGMVAAQQLKNASFDLAASLTLARSEALTRNVPVTIDPVAGDWARGWIVTEAGGTVLRRQAEYARIALSGPARVVYNGDGRPDSVATAFAVTAADAALDQYRCVTLRVNGRYSVTRGAC